MRLNDEQALEKSLKSGESFPVYLLWGSEDYLITRYARKLCAPFAGDSFNFQRLDGRRLDCDMLNDALETLPLFAEKKCVLVRDLDPAGISDQTKLEEILSDLPPGVLLVITARPPVFQPKSAGGKKLLELADKAGCCAELGPRGPGGLVEFLKVLAKKGRCTLSGDTARHILRICDNDMLALSAEMGKICAYAGGGELTVEQVDAVATPKTEARVFDLSKAILAGNPRRALEILDDLFYLREQPVAILSALSASYLDLYRAKAAKAAGALPPQVVKAFGYKGREFRVNNAFSSCPKLSAAYLRHAVETLYDCDRKLKSTRIDGRVLLEQTVMRLFALERQYPG